MRLQWGSPAHQLQVEEEVEVEKVGEMENVSWRQESVDGLGWTVGLSLLRLERMETKRAEEVTEVDAGNE